MTTEEYGFTPGTFVMAGIGNTDVETVGGQLIASFYAGEKSKLYTDWTDDPRLLEIAHKNAKLYVAAKPLLDCVLQFKTMIDSGTIEKNSPFAKQVELTLSLL